MKESTEQKIREYLENFRIKFTGEEKKGETVTLDDFITLYDDSSESSCFSCLSSDKNIHGCETVSDKIAEDICNIIKKDDEKEETTFTERKQILDKVINSFPEGDRFVTDSKKIKYIREDIVLEAIRLNAE